MGRFYKSARPTDIDYSYKMPLKAIAYAAEKKEKEIDETFDTLDKITGSLNEQKARTAGSFGKGMHLPGEEEAYNSKIQEYENQIEDISSAINDDLFNAGKQSQNIRRTRTALAQDFRSGDLYNFNKNAGVLNEWMKNNKDGDPLLKEAILKKNVEGFNSINENGGYNSLTLPDVNKTNVSKQSLIYAKGIVPYEESKVREGLIYNSLLEDPNIVNNIRQKLDYGLLKDEGGVIINADEMTPEEKNGAVQMELSNISKLAEVKTRTKPTAKNGLTVAQQKTKAKEQATYIGSTYSEKIGKGPTVSNNLTTINNYRNNNRNEDGSMMSSYDATTALITNYDNKLKTENNNAAKVSYNIQKSILEEIIKQADQAVMDKYIAAGGNPLDEHITAEDNIIRQQFIDENVKASSIPYTEAKIVGNNINAKAFATEMKDYSLSAVDNIVMESPQVNELNGKTITSARKENIIGRKQTFKNQQIVPSMFDIISNDSDLLEKINIITEPMKITEDGIEYDSFTYSVNEDDQEKVLKFATSTNDLSNLFASDDQGYVRKIGGIEDGKQKYELRIPIEKEKKDNFQIDLSSGMPVQVTDAEGNGKLRFDAVYNGEDITIYMSDKDFDMKSLNTLKDSKLAPPANNPTLDTPTLRQSNEANRLLWEAKNVFTVGSVVPILGNITLAKIDEETGTMELTIPASPATATRKAIPEQKIRNEKLISLFLAKMMMNK